MSKIKALVTGGAGFLGSHLCEYLLDKDWEVVCIDNLSSGTLGALDNVMNNSSFHFEEMDIFDLTPETAFLDDINYVFHLAGIESEQSSILSPTDYFRTNVLGTVKVLEATKSQNLKKFLYAASSTCYGVPRVPTLETDSLIPISPSALSKIQGEQAVFHWSHIYGVESCSLRIFDAYGPRCYSKNSFNNLFGIWMKQKILDQSFTMPGDGEIKRDFVYCEDVCQAFYLAALEGKNTECYNVGSGKPRTLNELMNLLKGKPNYLNNISKAFYHTWADLSKIQYDTNWAPRFSLEKGVEFSLKHLDSWENAPLWTEDRITEFLNR